MEAFGFQEKVTESVGKVSESVVVVRNDQLRQELDGNIYEVSGQGSGTVISQSGYILTNYHVVENSRDITVVDRDGNEIEAVNIGNDRATDIALLKIRNHNMKYADLGNSSDLKVGQVVLAVGNALGLTGSPSVSLGVISALGRVIPPFEFILGGLIQTDAAINPGNSGGPLSDISGRIIGINFSMIPYAQGIGFAIPIDFAKWVMQEILEHGKVMRPWLGISATSMRRLGGSYSRGRGVFVLHVARGSPAELSGLKRGDVITSINTVPTDDMSDVIAVIAKTPVGGNVEISGFRNGRAFKTSAHLIKFPDAPPGIAD